MVARLIFCGREEIYTSISVNSKVKKKKSNPVITKGECSLHFLLIYSLSVWGNQKAKEETIKKDFRNIWPHKN